MFKHLNKQFIMIKPLIVTLGVLSFVYSGTPVISNKSFLFCLKKEVKPLLIERTNNSINVGIGELNEFINDEQILNIEPWIPQAKETDRDGDIYLNRIYRVFVSEQRSDNIPSMISKLQSMSFVHYSEFEYIRKLDYLTNDTLSELQCSLSSIKTDKAWDFWDIENGDVPSGRHVILASVDTGVDYTHPDLENNSWINQGEVPSWMFEAGLDSDSDSYIDASEVLYFLETQFGDINGDGSINLRDIVSTGSPFEDSVDNDGNGFIDDLLGWDPSGVSGVDDNDPFPKEGSSVANNGTWAHGTHVAGILAATTNNNLGMASTAYNAKFMSVKVSRDNQSGEPGINDGYVGIYYAARAGFEEGAITIINNSWGGYGYSGSENATINTAVNTYGAVVVSAAGNGNESAGTQEYSSHYPSSYDNSIAVCAMGCSYNWGNWATYHNTIDLAAPGENVHSAIIGTGYEAWMGSSMASPNAASAIGLLSLYHPDWNNVQLRNRIEESADRIIYELNPDFETCNGNFGSDCFGSGMVDVYKAIGMDFSPRLSINSYILDPNNDTDPNTLMDNDSVVNPGETVDIIITLESEAGWQDASQVVASLQTDENNITIIDQNSIFGFMANGTSQSAVFSFEVDSNSSLGDKTFTLNVSAFGAGGYTYSDELSFNVEVSLNQEDFPYDTNSEIRSTPVVVDLDNDGVNEIVFADYFGNVRVMKDGLELDNDNFPYDTGNQIWGSVSSADIDLDGYQDFVVASKSGYLYVFDINGLKFDYNAERWLIATPVIGNIDSDSELEIVVGGYQSPTSSSPLFAVNHDGTPVSGFPYVVGEKMKSGVALYDMNDNGVDDIVFGTDGDNLYVLLDDLTVAPGFPLDLNGNIRSEPAILDMGDEKIIFSGSEDENMYAINYSDASIRFVIETGDDVYTSASFLEQDSNVEIYFGSDDGSVYGLDVGGNALGGFPRQLADDAAILGSVLFSDLDSDGLPDIVAADDKGNIYAQSMIGESLHGFPINYQFPFSSSPQIVDYDLDGDLDIICGTGGDLVMIDIKSYGGNSSDYWSLYKGDYSRAGYYVKGSSGGVCSGTTPGDVNSDSIFNVLDVVAIVGFALDSSNITESDLCTADINGDGIVNVIDVVAAVSLVLG